MFDSPDIHALEFDEAELERMLNATKRRSRELHTRRAYRRSAPGVLALVVVLTVTGFSVLGVPRDRGSKPQANHPTTVPVLAPSWKLVGDISPAWRTLPATRYPLGIDLTCPTASTCYASDWAARQVEVTHDGGANWQQSDLPSGMTQTVSNLSCGDADSCGLLAIDSSGDSFFLTTVDGGQTWNSVPGPSTLPLSAVPVLSCVSVASCVILAFEDESGVGPASSFVTSDGGQTWSKSALPTGYAPIRVECFAAGNCVSTGYPAAPSTDPSSQGEALYSTDGGSTWLAASVPAGVGAMTSISCSDALDCYSVSFDSALGNADSTGSSVLVTSDGGQAWSNTGTTGLPNSLLTSVACPSSSYCWASGVVVPKGTGRAISFANAQGMLAMTTDQGQSWQPATLPPGIRAVAGLSCPDTSTCYALGFEKPANGNGSFVLMTYGT